MESVAHIPKLQPKKGIYIMLKYLAKRLLTFIPLMFGIILVVFILLRLMPGNPAYRLAGTNANEAMINAITEKMGLDKPIWDQFIIYVQGLLRGDFGISWNTSNPVAQDLLVRIPATLELITLTMIACIGIGVFLGSKAAMNEKGIISKIANGYGLVAGAIADFWLGLMLVYFFFYVLGWLPAPLGRLGLMTTPPETITGAIIIDSIITGNLTALWDGILHLILPVTALTFCMMGQIMKMMRASMTDILHSDFISYAKMMGLPQKVVRKYAIRNALPPVVTMIGYVYGFLLGGAVLIETVFSWGGLGQYVTQAIAFKDYAAVQGFMIVATIFSMFVYLIVDIVYMLIDPRIRF